MRDCREDQHEAGETAAAGAPSDPGPARATSLEDLVEAVAELLDDLVEAPAVEPTDAETTDTEAEATETEAIDTDDG